MARNRPAVGSTKRARRLRNNPTDAERRLWRILRRCFPDARFRRQVPVGSYVVDFCSHGAKLIVEADGGQHGADQDRVRTLSLRAEDYRLIRFWNHDILANGDGVATAIAEVLDGLHPSPTPPTQGEGDN